MLNILIADDEQKICQLIEKLIDWPRLNMQVIGTAKNGLEALEKIQSLHPDIVITDIRMPGYDGLELIRLGKEYSPKTEFIIISGYRHFEYAQTAIRYGVHAYVLKPIKKDELTEVLRKLGERFQENTVRKNSQEQLQQTLNTDKKTLRRTFLLDFIVRRRRDRLSWPIQKINQEFRYSFSSGEFCIAVLKMDGQFFDNLSHQGFMDDKVEHAAARLLKDGVIDYEILFFGGFYYFLLQMYPEQRGGLRRQMKLLLDELRVQGDIVQDFAVTIALGKNCGALSALEASLDGVLWNIEERLVAGTGKLYENEVLEKPQVRFAEFSEFSRQFSLALESLEVFPVRDCLRRLKEQLLAVEKISGHEILQTAKEVISLYVFSMKNYQMELDEGEAKALTAKTENCASAAELLDYLIRALTASYEKAAEKKRQKENRPIRIVKQFIAAHYQEALTLEQVSAAAGLSPSYFSTVFKKDTGMTFLEYLSGVRMDAAKQLLKETNRTIADICAAVGYSDVRYFTKSFTKYSGLKPNEYRKLYS